MLLLTRHIKNKHKFSQAIHELQELTVERDSLQTALAGCRNENTNLRENIAAIETLFQKSQLRLLDLSKVSERLKANFELSQKQVEALNKRSMQEGVSKAALLTRHSADVQAHVASTAAPSGPIVSGGGVCSKCKRLVEHLYHRPNPSGAAASLGLPSPLSQPLPVSPLIKGSASTFSISDLGAQPPPSHARCTLSIAHATPSQLSPAFCLSAIAILVFRFPTLPSHPVSSLSSFLIASLQEMGTQKPSQEIGGLYFTF